MIIDSVQRKYQVVLTAAKTTTDMSVVVNWEHISKMPNLTPTIARTNTNGVTAVDILATTDLPKRINSLTIYNADTAPKTVQVFLNDTGTAFLIISATLQPGETLGYSESTQWYTGGQTGPFALLNGNSLEDFAAHQMVVGNAGTEGLGINIGGVIFEASLKVSDIDGTNYAQTILHRHSTTLEPLIVGARSNSDTTGHANVTTGQGIFSVYAAGWAGSNYKLFGSESFMVGTGTVSNTSSPGKWSLKITPDGATTPVETHYVDSDGLLHGSVAQATAAGHAVRYDQIQTAVKTSFPIAVSYNAGAAQTLTTNVYAAITVDTELVDNTNSSVAGLFTAPITGWYHVQGIIRVNSATISQLQMDIYKNGVSQGVVFNLTTNALSAAHIQPYNKLIKLTAGDTCQPWILAQGTTLTVSGTTANPHSIYLVKAD